MDTARAKTTLPATYDRTLPHLAELSKDATVFENAATVAPWTLPSHASVFTGQYTSTHKTDAKTPLFEPDVSPLAEQLSNRGYLTGGISANPWVSPEFGFNRGFEDFSMKWDRGWNQIDLTAAVNSESTIEGLLTIFKQTSPRRYPTLLRSLWHKKFSKTPADNGANQITTRASEWIKNQSDSDDPFFLFLNYLEPHLPYTPPEEFSEEFLTAEELQKANEIDQDPWRYIAGQVSHSDEEFQLLEKLYLAEIKYLDAQIGRLFDWLKESGLYEETAIFVIGDHGENIGEHELMDHQYCLYDTLVNVPLLAKHPDLESGAVEERPVESRDLYPTILQLASVPTESLPETVSRETLTDSSREYTVSEYLTPQPSVDTLAEWVDTNETLDQFDRVFRAIRGTDWKLIESSDGTESLYHISEDPDEGADLASEKTDTVKQLSTTLSDTVGKLERMDSERTEIDDQSRHRLEELGYLQ